MSITCHVLWCNQNTFRWIRNQEKTQEKRTNIRIIISSSVLLGIPFDNYYLKLPILSIFEPHTKIVYQSTFSDFWPFVFYICSGRLNWRFGNFMHSIRIKIFKNRREFYRKIEPKLAGIWTVNTHTHDLSHCRNTLNAW